MLVSIVCVVCAIALAITSAFTFWPVTAGYDFYRPIVMFIAGLFTIDEIWIELKCPSKDEWAKKM